MDRRIIWTETAWHDLEQITGYIARDSSHYAASFACEVRDASRSLSRFAERGRSVPELDESGCPGDLRPELSPGILAFG